jgi:hypothetical protein
MAQEPEYLQPLRKLIAKRQYTRALDSAKLTALNIPSTNILRRVRFATIIAAVNELIESDEWIALDKRLDRHAEIEYLINRERGDEAQLYRKYSKGTLKPLATEEDKA